MDDAQLLKAQRSLRQQYLDAPPATQWSGARDLLAHMLLHLEDGRTCLGVLLAWLRELFDADRCDGSFGDPSMAAFRIHAESCRPSSGMPSVVGVPISNQEEGVRQVWRAEGAVCFRDAPSEPSFSATLRSQLARQGVSSKLSIALRHRRQPVGVICLDWNAPIHAPASERVDLLEALCRGPAADVLRCAIGAAQGEGESRREALAGSLDLCVLTETECRVAALVVNGLSYKEIARVLGRSTATVDQHLRSIRSKLAVRSTARLIALLTPLLTPQDGGFPAMAAARAMAGSAAPPWPRDCARPASRVRS